MVRRAKGEGSIIHVKPLACKVCSEYSGCTVKEDLSVRCSKRDRRERWVYQYWKVTPEGGKRRTSLCATSRKALLDKIEKLKGKADDGRYHDDVTLGKWIDIWEMKYLPHTVNKPNALIVDFFAGSGTTAHATMLLNHLDGGHTKTFIVSNLF